MRMLAIIAVGGFINLATATVCQNVFPTALVSESGIIFHGGATVEGSGNALASPRLERGRHIPSCDGKPCNATGSPVAALHVFTSRESMQTNTIEIVENVTLSDSDLPNIVVAADDVTITFDAPPSETGLHRLQKIGNITDNAKNTSYVFKAGDYHIRSWTIDNNPGNRKNPIVNDRVSIQPEGHTRLFIKEGLTVNKFTPPNPNNPVLAVNNQTKSRPKKLLGFIPAGEETLAAKSGELLIYTLGDAKIDTFGNYDINALIYSYGEIGISGDPLSRFSGAMHSKGTLTIGHEDRSDAPNGRFVYDDEAVNALYKLLVCNTMPDDPGSAGKETLEGIDTNRNGVRDDMERYIDQRFGASAKERAIALQYARASQIIIREPEQALELDRYMTDAIDCKWYYYKNYEKRFEYRQEHRIFDNDFEDHMFDTKERLRAYIRYNGALSGHIFGDREQTKENCLIDIDILE